MGTNQQFSLRWNNYVQHITCAFDNLRSDEDLVDVTLSCEGRKILAHKMLLSACSTYFKNVFKENPCKHPVIIFRNVKFEDLVAIVDFMYHGEVNVEQEQLSSFLTTAEMLAVQGLTDGTGPTKENYKEENRRRPPSLLESSLLGTVQDSTSSSSTSIRQNHHQKPAVSRPTIPHTSNSFQNQSQPNRPSTPTSNNNRKRKFSPVKIVNSITNKESGESDAKQNKKKSVKDDSESVDTPIVPKVEVNDYDDNDSSYSEQESGMMDVNQLIEKNQEKESVEMFSTNSRDSPYPAMKSEGVPSSEIDKGISAMSDQAMLKPGTSGNVDTLQESIFGEMEEEYLEEETRSEVEGDVTEGMSEFVIIDETVGEPEYLEEPGEDEEEAEGEEVDEEEDVVEEEDDADEDEEAEEGAVEQEMTEVVEGEEMELTDVLAVGETTEGFAYSPEVKYIYAEAVNENNEIIIGEVPKFNCKFCSASFKRLDSLYKHNSVHKGKTICPVCSAVFSRVAHRTRHMRLKHPDVEVVLTRKRGSSQLKKGKEIKVEEVQSDSFNILNAI